MSSITNNLLFNAGVLGLAGSALTELVRYTAPSISLPISQGATTTILIGSAIITAVTARSKFSGPKPIITKATMETEKVFTEKILARMDTEEVEVYKTSDAEKTVYIVGKSRLGKTTFFNQFFHGLQCGRSSIYRGTENTKLLQKKCGNTTWILKDTPGLSETAHPGKTRRDDETIIEKQIKPMGDEEVHAVIFTFNCTRPDPSEVQALMKTYPLFPKTAKKFILFTRCEEQLATDSIQEIKKNLLNQQVLKCGELSQNVRAALANCPVLLSGTLTDGRMARVEAKRKVNQLCNYMNDAQETLVKGLLSEDSAATCLTVLNRPFQPTPEQVDNIVGALVSGKFSPNKPQWDNDNNARSADNNNNV